MSGPKQQVLSLKLSGLFTDPNTFSEVPEGITLSKADNVVIDKNSIIGSRRGFPQYGNPPSGTNPIDTFVDFQDTLIVHDEGAKFKFDQNGDGSVWFEYDGTYQPPDAGEAIPSFQSNKNLYVGTSNGIYKLTAPADAFRQAGAPRGLGGAGQPTGSSGFQSTDTNVAYRVVWGYRDVNANLILGSPSDRIIVSNTTGGERNVSVSFYIPRGVNAGYSYQIYRSSQTINLSTEPDDELQMVAQLTPTSGELSAGFVTFVDSTPDNLRSTLIYTASSLTTGGILNANTQPPFARTMCSFKNFSFYGNTRTKHSFDLALIAVAGTVGVAIDDNLTVSDGLGAQYFQLIGAAAENSATGRFKVTSNLTPAENIELTARSIVNVINSYSANTQIVAYYASGYQELPGRILLERLSLSPDVFTVTSNRTQAWRPVLQLGGPAFNIRSRNEALVNRVYFSKQQQPEAVPGTQYFDIGSAEEPILAMVPLRDGIIVLKTDGVFRISGTSISTFQVSPIDTTVRIIAKNSVAVLNNKVYFFSTQGIVACSDNSAALVSRSIESDLLELSSSLYPNFAGVSFATAYESDRKYILWLPSTPYDTQATQAYVLNALTGDWTRWTKTASTAIVKQNNDKLYIAGPAVGENTQYVFQERKNFNLSDFADEQYNINIVSVSGTVLTVSSTDKVLVGYTIQQDARSVRVIRVISPTQLEMDAIALWEGGPAIAYRPIYQFFETNQLDAGNPGMMKHWADCSAIFRPVSFKTLDVDFISDVTNQINRVVVVGPPGGDGWGTFPWGLRPWGSASAITMRLRMSIPANSQRSNWIGLSMTLGEAFTDISLAGIALTYSPMSTRMKGASRA